MQKKTVIKQREVFSGSLVKVVENIVIFNQHEIPLEAFHVPAVSLVVPFIDGKYVLVKQYRHSVNETIYEFPAGKIAPGETPLEAAKRELLEETGLTAIEINEVAQLACSPEYGQQIVYIYGSNSLKAGVPSPEIYEKITLKKVKEEVLLQMIKNGEIKDSKTISAFFLYKLSDKFQ